ncbi:hypothetical protein [Aureimonas endophytica]|uniref:hypothetical protein n=1 Tax=Aureimonas endophytica TaxID=2027858 RepID=UPI00166AE764|nr:hypothetical protein [Aureimonas endophytica]
MAERSKKKPASRKAAPPKRSGGRGWFSTVGWLATVAVAGAWAVSDGRPLRYAMSLTEKAKPETREIEAVGDRVAALIEGSTPWRPAPTRETVRRVSTPEAPERTGSIRPVPPVPAAVPRPPVALPPPRGEVPVPAAAPLLPFAKPPMEAAAPRSAPMAAPAPIAAPPPPTTTDLATSGAAQRHATRKLAAHAAPDGASARLAEIDSGSSVLVMRAAGDWRYVKSLRSGSEGWVDGRFLAGEATADAGAMPR